MAVAFFGREDQDERGIERKKPAQMRRPDKAFSIDTAFNLLEERKAVGGMW